jgi:putative DNA primase/helicase
MRPQIKKPLAKGLVTTADSSYSKTIEQIRQEASLAVAKFTEASKASNETSAKVISIQSYEQSAFLQKASELKPKPINWLWNGWIAGGKFHLLGGVAGTGKTTISLALVSSITTGGRFPDGSKAPKGNVVVWTGEDDVCDTLTPRLMAMGADLDRVHFIQGMKTGNEERPFEPSSDMPFLKDAIEKIGDVKVLIIDPIVSVVKGDSHKNAEVRKDLTPLVQMAEQIGFAIIGITHFSKGTSGREPIERITGSLAFGAVARVVLVASKTKNEDGDDIRIFLRAKSNIGIDEGGFEYSLESATTDNGIETSRVIWGSLIEGSARELLGDAEEESTGGGIKGCMSLIADLLAYGEVSATQMEKDCKGADYSVATIRRAKKQLGIKSIKRGMGSKGIWVWELPKMLNLPKDAHTNRVNTLGKSEHLNEAEIVEGEL